MKNFQSVGKNRDKMGRINADSENVEKTEHGKIRKLSLPFAKHISIDIAKKALLPPKIILEGLSLWPGNDSFALKILNWGVLLNLCFMEWGHVSYVLHNISDVAKMASACTTVSTTFQTICKIATLRIFKKDLNDILCQVWDDFWPAEVASEETKRKIKGNVSFVKFFCFMYLCTAFVSCSQFMAYPLVNRNGNLPLASTYPFSYGSLPTYEIFYVWQWFSNFIVVCVLSGHDFFLSALIMNCVAQFLILQDVLKNLYEDEDGMRRKMDLQLGTRQKYRLVKAGKFSERRQILFKCIYHHMKILKLIVKMENVFSFIVFMQFFVSAMALCVSSFVLTVNSSEAMNMLSYAMAHLMQLFIYCSMGNELIYQSEYVAGAAFQCGWYLFYDKSVRHGLLMLVQRSQKPSQLTALGFVELSYRSFLMILRMSFSFYTMLDNMKNK